MPSDPATRQADSPAARTLRAQTLRAQTMRAQAWVLGSRLELRGRVPPGATPPRPIAEAPLTFAFGPGRYAMAFRYGAVVFFGFGPEEEREAVRHFAAFAGRMIEDPETEEIELRIDPDGRERVDADGFLVLHSPEVHRLQVVAHILAKSAVLSHYEGRVALVFDRVEARAEELQRGPSHRRSRELLAEIGSALAIQAQTVGRVEVTEKPELTWDDAELDRLYERLARDYEIRDRDAALTRKLDLVSDTAATSLDLIHTRQGLRVEWYIVILILVEIAIIVYDQTLR